MSCCSQQGFNTFLPSGGFGPPQGMPPHLAQAVMQQQAVAAMFGTGQPGMPGCGTGPPGQMFPPPGMDPAMAMRDMHFAQALAANAAMMGFQVEYSTAQIRFNSARCWHILAVPLALSQLPNLPGLLQLSCICSAHEPFCMPCLPCFAKAVAKALLHPSP